MNDLFAGYPAVPGAYDELIGRDGKAHATFRKCLDMLAEHTPEEIAHQQALAELALLHQGVTFSVYKDTRGTEKIFPFCLIPRIISAADWATTEKGLEQRLAALNLFLDDVYGEQRIFRDHPLLAEMVLGAAGYKPQLRGIKPAGGVRVHIAGIDLIRDPDGVFRVLEDNVRTPSGVSYVLENRALTKRIHPRLIDAARVRRVDDYAQRLSDSLRSVSPVAPADSTVVVLTPGSFNSAYFEHTFLARQMGAELVQGADLYVSGDEVFLRTTRGPRRVHVVYRRIDDAYLDPEWGNPDTVLGVPGIMRAWAAGKVTLVNAPGNGVADDKAIYPFVPDMIKFYLGEESLLQQVPTYMCSRKQDRAYVLTHLDQLVVKAVDEAGGYGMLMGPQASLAERAEFATRIKAEPRRYIAQPRIELSTCPTWLPDTKRVEPRRVDLRPYVLTGREGTWVLPGGLTRVALVKGSYVVNSSQGGGSKDTWVQK